MENKGIEPVHATASDFIAQYKNEKFILILGGPDSYERVRGVVREVLTNSEQNLIRKSGARKMYVKTDVWSAGQKVMVIAGSDREQTRAAHQENRNEIAFELEV